MKDTNEVGLIHEVGDMGLGFDPISEQEQEQIEESKEEEK